MILRNDLVITESNRVKILEDAEGRSVLRFDPASNVDVGIYKVVARNKVGQTQARTRWEHVLFIQVCKVQLIFVFYTLKRF